MKLLHHTPRPTQLRSASFPNEFQLQMQNETLPNPMSSLSSDAPTDTNAPKPFNILQPDWIELTPYGDFPHPLGLQRMDRLAAERIAANFHSFWQKLGRHFAGVPIYIGHPDVPELGDTYPDKKAYGWITDLQVRPSGLYAKAKWSAAGQDLLQNAHYKFYSPYWEAAFLGEENRQQVYRPTALLSLGLTNQPNLPVLPLANTADYTTSLPPAKSPQPDNLRPDNLELIPSLPSVQPSTPYPKMNPPSPIANPKSSPTSEPDNFEPDNLKPTANLQPDNMITPPSPPHPNPHYAIRDAQSFPNTQPDNLRPDNMITIPSPSSRNPHSAIRDPQSPSAPSQPENLRPDNMITAPPPSQPLLPSVQNPSPSSQPNPHSAIPNPQSIVPLANEVLALQTLLYQRDERLLALQNQYDTARSSWVQTQAMLQNKVAALENSRIEIVLDHAVYDGRLAPCERPFWNAQLRRDFDTRHAELQSKPETIHMKSITGNLGKNQIDLSDFPSRQQLLQELIAAKKTAGLTYDQAWTAAKTERPDLFEAMNANF